MHSHSHTFCLKAILIILLTTSFIQKQYAYTTVVDDPTDCDIEVNVPDDFHICLDEEFELGGEILGDYDDYLWIENFSETNYDLDESVSIDGTTVFTLVAWFQSEENIIENGDFEGGFSGFTTDYMVGTSSCFGLGYLDCEGTFDVIDNPTNGHNNFASCSDVEGGGNMMVVNGASNLQEIWCQEVCVLEGSEYVFSAWAASVNPSSPAELQFSIDGNLIGSLFSLNSSLCDWEEFEASWTASASTTVEICVTNQNTAAGGNDFALDNIGFYQVCTDQSSFTVTLSEFEVDLFGTEDLDCDRDQTEGLISVVPESDYQFELYLGNFLLEDVDGEEFEFEINQAGEYQIVVRDMFGCEEEIEFEIEENLDKPDLELIPNGSLDCTNQTVRILAESATRSIIIDWYDSSENFIDSDDELIVDEEGTYIAEAIDPDNGCTTRDTIRIVRNDEVPSLEIVASGILNCQNERIELNAIHKTENITWYDGTGSVLVQNRDTIVVDSAGFYFVKITDSTGCTKTDSIQINNQESSFDYSIAFEDTLDCIRPVSEVRFDLDTSLYSVSWSDSSVTYLSPVTFLIRDAASYQYTLTDSIGCTLQDTIVIIEDFSIAPHTVTADSINCNQMEATASYSSSDSTQFILWLIGTDTLAGDSIAVNQEGVIDYLVTNSNGCTVTGSIEIHRSSNVPSVRVFGNSIDCNSPETTVYFSDDGTLMSHYWKLPDGSESFADTLYSNLAGIYTLVFNDSLGCMHTESLLVTADTIPPEFSLMEDLVLSCDSTNYSGILDIEAEYAHIRTNGSWLDTTKLDYQITEPGIYFIELTGQNGCTQRKEIQVSIDTIPPTFNIIDTVWLDCTHPERILHPNISSDYRSLIWRAGQNTSEEDSVRVSVEGSVQLEVTAENGCMESREIQVLADFKGPEFEIAVDTISCNDTLAEIHLEGDGTISYIINSNQVIDTLEIGYFETTQAGFYTVIGTALNGCTTERTFEIPTDTSKIDFTAFADTLDCLTDHTEIRLESDTEIPLFTIIDSTGIEIPSSGQHITEAGEYTVIVEKANGCTSAVSIEVIEQKSIPLIEALLTEEFNCSESLSLSGITISGGKTPFSLSVDDRELSLEDLPFIVSGAGTHDIRLIDANSCTADTSIYIETVQPLDIFEEPDIVLGFGEEHQIQVELNKRPDELLEINWLPKEGLSCYDCLNPVFAGESDVVYHLTVIDNQGCMDSISLRIKVMRDIRFYIPNAIIIDGNGNSNFTVFSRNDDLARILSMRIFDRWGNEVFVRDDFEPGIPDLGWDGYFNNGKVEQGVYVYTVQLLFANGNTQTVAGDLTVFR